MRIWGGAAALILSAGAAAAEEPGPKPLGVDWSVQGSVNQTVEVIDNQPLSSPSGDTIYGSTTRVGATIGTLDVTVDDGTGPQLIYSATGPGTAEWEIVTAALPAGLGSYQVTFTYARGTSFTGDIAVDGFCILQ